MAFLLILLCLSASHIAAGLEWSNPPAAAPSPAEVPSPAASPSYNKKVFMEYIGASGKPVSFTDVPINPALDFHFILGFAIDATPQGNPNNGIFTPFWLDTLTPQVVSSFKQAHPNVKILASLGGWSMYNPKSGKDEKVFWYDPKDKQQWLANAFQSLSTIIKDYNLDGIDIDYESMKPHNNFSSTLGELLTRLKTQGVSKIITIAPFTITNEYYIQLFNAYHDVIDYVNYQFYTELISNTTKYLEIYHEKAKVFGYDKLLASYEVLGRGLQGDAWFEEVSLIKSQANLCGIMIYSADESVSLHYYYETKSQEMLLTP